MADLIMYGIWIPRTGWLRGEEGRALMFTERVVAQETARRIGKKAKVFFIDRSLVDIEPALLDAEREKVFELKKFFQFAEWIRK